MGIFSNSSSFDPIVEKCTAETNTKEDWSLMLDICDKVGSFQEAPKECLRAILHRLNHRDPHVVLLAITLLDACVNNCGRPFHLEVASREFEQEYRKLLQKHQEKTIRDKLLSCLQKWAENEFKSDPQLDLIPSLYLSLKAKGLEFPSDSPNKAKKSGHHHHHKSKDHTAAVVQQEEADLAKAIELSLKETQHGSPQNKSLYPQMSGATGSSAAGGSTAKSEKEPRKVRALYDFEAVEDNELTFYSGEILFVLDSSDPNWWEGENQRGRGLFPANFVSSDLDAEPSQFETKKIVQFSEEVEVKSIETEPEVVEIDENKIDLVLHLLHEADPTGEVADPHELAPLEEQVQQMGPLIDQELEKIDRRHAQLTRLGGELVEALNMYHNLMRDPGFAPPASLPYNMKLGAMPMGPGPTSLPNFHAGGPIQHPYGAYPYDPNGLAYPIVHPNPQQQQPQPPHSAPPSTGYNNSMPYPANGVGGTVAQMNSPPPPQQPSIAGAGGQPTSLSQAIPNPQMSVGQAPGPQMMGGPPAGQIPYSQPGMMMGQPPPVHHMGAPVMAAPQMGSMPPAPQPNPMQIPASAIPVSQQFAPAQPFYSQPPSNAPPM